MNGMLSNGFLVKIPKESFLHCVECRQCTSAESESCCRLSCWQRSEVKQTMQRWPFQRGSRLCRWCVLELHNALAWARKWHIPQTDPPLSPGPLWPKQLHEKNWVFWANILRHSTTEILEMRRNMSVWLFSSSSFMARHPFMVCYSPFAHHYSIQTKQAVKPDLRCSSSSVESDRVIRVIVFVLRRHLTSLGGCLGSVLKRSPRCLINDRGQCTVGVVGVRA